jgi:hypothetical protein
VIVCSILGGLGNQMFQFAAGRALALDRGENLKLDVSGFERYGLHQGFQLENAFHGKFDLATESEVSSILGWQRRPLTKRILSHPAAASLRKNGWVVEPHFQYWNGVHDAPADCYLQGYWQSERYFQAHAAAVRADFSFKSALTAGSQSLARQIRQLNAVSLHVRRGDYVKDRATAAQHGVCSLDYYNAAVQHVLRRVANPVFFVFSDDMPWVKTHLKLAAPTQHVEHNDRAFDDMHLMSLCKHHVIANSSFSWWGAWLNASPDKIVVAPKHWFATTRRTEDLLPAAWVTL